MTEHTPKKRNWGERRRIGGSWALTVLSAIMIVLGAAEIAVTGGISGGAITVLLFNAIMLFLLNQNYPRRQR
ncbi:MAG: hypothetical protein AAB573_03525 [Patescibacteria group bacterium]